jgi:hypothetical protein
MKHSSANYLLQIRCAPPDPGVAVEFLVELGALLLQSTFTS